MTDMKRLGDCRCSIVSPEGDDEPRGAAAPRSIFHVVGLARFGSDMKCDWNFSLR